MNQGYFWSADKWTGDGLFWMVSIWRIWLLYHPGPEVSSDYQDLNLHLLVSWIVNLMCLTTCPPDAFSRNIWSRGLQVQIPSIWVRVAEVIKELNWSFICVYFKQCLLLFFQNQDRLFYLIPFLTFQLSYFFPQAKVNLTRFTRNKHLMDFYSHYVPCLTKNVNCNEEKVHFFHCWSIWS